MSEAVQAHWAVHPLATCCWCGASFVCGPGAVEVTHPERKYPWVCPVHWRRQIDAAMLVNVKGRPGGLVTRFVPLPRQVEAIDALHGRYRATADGPVVSPTYILIGGAAGGSKSKGLREIAHAECMQTPNFRVLLLRRTYKELDQTHIRDAEIEAPEMGAVTVPSAKLVRYPNGSTLQFGHCETSADAANYLSAEYDLIIFDELVTFEELQFLLISSRARSTKPGVVPKVLAGTNPGGPQAHWVRSRFIDKTVDLAEYPDYAPDDYLYIPSKLDDNPYLDQQYEKKLLALPPELRRAYRDGDWDIFPGQYFPEFRRRTHVTAEPQDCDRTWPRVLCMDWGYVKSGYVGWIAQSPEGWAYLEDEYTPVRVNAFEQGVEVGRRIRERRLTRVSYLVYDYQMETPSGDNGEPLIDTFKRGLRSMRVSLTTKKSDKDRRNGWPRLRGWFRMAPTDPPRPWLQFSPTCTYAARTLPALLSAPTDAEDVDSDGEDHAADALRYWAMSRPEPVKSVTTMVAPPGSFGWYKAQRAPVSLGVLAR